MIKSSSNTYCKFISAADPIQELGLRACVRARGFKRCRFSEFHLKKEVKKLAEHLVYRELYGMLWLAGKKGSRRALPTKPGETKWQYITLQVALMC